MLDLDPQRVVLTGSSSLWRLTDCSPASSTVAGPTLPLDSFQAMVKGPTKGGGGWNVLPPAKVMVGLPAFGYSFPCTNPQPPGFPVNNTCLMEQVRAQFFLAFFPGPPVLPNNGLLFGSQKLI